MTAPAGPRRLEWQLDHRVREEDTVVLETTAHHPWHVATPAEISDELPAAGLRLQDPEEPDGLYTVPR